MLKLFQNLKKINLAVIQPQAAGIFEAQIDSSIKLSWDNLKDSDIDLTYTFVFTFQDSNNPESIFKASV